MGFEPGCESGTLNTKTLLLIKNMQMKQKTVNYIKFWIYDIYSLETHLQKLPINIITVW